MNKYNIFEYDKKNSEVLVDFEYNGHQLRDRVKVTDFSDISAMQSAIEQNFAQFAKYTETLQPEPEIPQEATDLIGVEVEVNKLAVIVEKVE